MLIFSNVKHLPRNRVDISFWIKLDMVMNEITNCCGRLCGPCLPAQAAHTAATGPGRLVC